jgi:PmbA protein
MTADLTEVLDRLLEQAEQGEALEAFGVDATETVVKADRGEVESLSSARTRGVGVRVVRESRVGYAYTADLSEAALDEVLTEARSNAAVATPDEANVLPAAAPAADLPGLYDEAIAEVPTEAKVDLALRLEAAARGASPRIRGVDIAQYGDSTSVRAIASTEGVRGAYQRGDAWLLVEAVAEADGAATSAYGMDVARVPAALDVEGTAGEAVERATRLLGGRKPAGARIPVLLDPFATASLLAVIAGALTAEAVQKGRSLFADKIGEDLATDTVTLIDDGRHADGLAAAPWDGEGVPTGATTLIGDGVLRGFLHNTYTAAKDGVTSTGNASRGGFKTAPGVSSSNLYLEPGTSDQTALLAAAGEAFYCQQVMGLHSGANPISGDFSVGASGLMVRDGAFAEPVREVSIASTIPEILAGIREVGSDLRFLPIGGGAGGMTLLVDGMTLSGA